MRERKGGKSQVFWELEPMALALTSLSMEFINAFTLYNSLFPAFLLAFGIFLHNTTCFSCKPTFTASNSLLFLLFQHQMKIFGWMQNKLNGKLGTKKQNFISVNNHRQQEPNRNEEFSDWPHGLLSIGTFGNKDMKEDSKNNNSVQENLSQDHLQQLTLEQVEKLQNEINLLLHKQVGPNYDGTESGQTDKITLDGNRISEDDRTNDDNVCSVDSNDRDCHLQDSTGVVLGKGTALGSTINKKSLSFLLKKMLICRGGFTPTPCLRDQVPESRMEKILRTILHKKIYPQNPSSASSTKKYLENKQKPCKSAIANEDDGINQKDDKGSKWVKTDSEYIVLEI